MRGRRVRWAVLATAVGAALAVLGLLLAAGLAGFALGRRPAPRSPLAETRPPDVE